MHTTELSTNTFWTWGYWMVAAQSYSADHELWSAPTIVREGPPLQVGTTKHSSCHSGGTDWISIKSERKIKTNKEGAVVERTSGNHRCDHCAVPTPLPNIWDLRWVTENLCCHSHMLRHVLFQATPVRKRLGADNARERFLSRVCTHVKHQVFLATEPCRAVITSERPLPRVSACVRVQRGFLAKWSIADAAHEWSLPCVDAQVSLEVSPLTKWQRADGAGERLFACMRSDMACEIQLSFERSRAQLTLIRSFLCVFFLQVFS